MSRKKDLLINVFLIMCILKMFMSKEQTTVTVMNTKYLAGTHITKLQCKNVEPCLN